MDRLSRNDTETGNETHVDENIRTISCSTDGYHRCGRNKRGEDGGDDECSLHDYGVWCGHRGRVISSARSVYDKRAARQV
jgi:hypothetical protein